MRLNCVEEFAIKNFALRAGQLARLLEARFPLPNRRMVGGSANLLMHRSKESCPLMRTARRTGDRFDKLSLAISQNIVPKVMAFRDQTRQTRARLICRGREEKRGRRDRKARRRQFPMTRDELIEHLIVFTAADAVDEPVGNQQPQDGGERQTRAEPVAAHADRARSQRGGGLPAIGLRIECESISITNLQREASSVRYNMRPLPRAARQIIEPEGNLDAFL